MNKTFTLGFTVTALTVLNPYLAEAFVSDSEKHPLKKSIHSTSLELKPSDFESKLNYLSPLVWTNHQINSQNKARVNQPSNNANSSNVNHNAHSIIGMASWYGPGFEGRLSANGEVFNPNELTAAHPTLPFNTRVRVTNLSNNRSVVVRINDRGPYANNRIIDLSARAAREIDMVNHGVTQVRLDIL
jgi:rare lipoprotein A (peptidoglycan hydrolase)